MGRASLSVHVPIGRVRPLVQGHRQINPGVTGSGHR
jgi:hypothetical protein